MSTAYTPRDLDITGPYLRCTPRTDRTFSVIVHDILDWTAEISWDERRLVSYAYLCPGVLGTITGLADIEDLTVEWAP